MCLFCNREFPGIPVITSENTLREFPLVIATVAKVSRKRGLWLVVRANKAPEKSPAPMICTRAKMQAVASFFYIYCNSA